MHSVHMENISTPCAAAHAHALVPTRLDLIARGGVASPAYLDVDATLHRAWVLLAEHPNRAMSIAQLRALATRLGVHAEQLFRDNVREVATRLPGGLTVSLPTWSSDYVRLTYHLLLTYAQQAEERIVAARGVRS